MKNFKILFLMSLTLFSFSSYSADSRTDFHAVTDTVRNIGNSIFKIIPFSSPVEKIYNQVIDVVDGARDDIGTTKN